MKSIGKAAEFLRKAAGALRGKAAVLRARLLFLASFRRRMAVVAGISRHIRALTPREKPAAAQCRGTAVAPPPADGEDEHVVGLPELARLFEQVTGDEDGGGYPGDWALTLRALFDDERRRAGGGGFAVVDGGLDADEEEEEEASVMDVIRRRREGDGVEFRMEEEIDQGADMYIARVRRRIMSTLNGIE